MGIKTNEPKFTGFATLDEAKANVTEVYDVIVKDLGNDSYFLFCSLAAAKRIYPALFYKIEGRFAKIGELGIFKCVNNKI